MISGIPGITDIYPAAMKYRAVFRNVNWLKVYIPNPFFDFSCEILLRNINLNYLSE